MLKYEEQLQLYDSSPRKLSKSNSNETKSGCTDDSENALNNKIDVKVRKNNAKQKQEWWIKNKETQSYVFKLFTCFYSLFIVVGGVVFEMANLISNGSQMIHTGKDLILGLWLLGGSIAFIVYCFWVVHKHHLEVAKKRKEFRRSLILDPAHPEPQVLSNSSTGSLYLRLGCVVFGLISVVYYALLFIICVLGWNEEQKHEGERTLHSNILNVISAVFIFVQMWFVYCNGKIVFTDKGNIARIGLMHLVGTNLWMWLRYIIYEEVETIHEIHRFQAAMQKHKHEDINEEEICKGVLCVFEGYSEFMYTCVVEYSLLCAGVAFVFWTSIEPEKEEMFEKQTRKRSRLTIDCSRTAVGLFTGFIFIICTLLAVALYNAFSGYKEIVGQWIFSCTNLTFLAWATIICIAAFWRMRVLKFKREELEDEDASAELLDRILLVVGLIGELVYGIGAILSFVNNPSHGLPLLICITNIVRLLQVTLQSGLIIIVARLEIDPDDEEMERCKPGKQLITLLLMLNVSQFFMDVFDAQKAGVNDDVLRMYGSYNWAFLVRACSPLTIFYRFHSSAVFADIWKKTFRVPKRAAAHHKDHKTSIKIDYIDHN